MTYFSNGTEAELWTADNCQGCIHNREELGCPVLNCHWLANHDQHSGPRATTIKDLLDMLIPRDGVHSGPCSMRVPSDGHEAQEAVVQAQEAVEKTRGVVAWLKRCQAQEEVSVRAEELALQGEDPGDVPVSLRALQSVRKKWAADRFPQASESNQMAALCHVMEEVGELSRVHRLRVDQPELDVQKLEAKRQDAVGDIVITMARYSTASGLDLETCVLDAWRSVRSRSIYEARRSYRPEWRSIDSNPATAGEDTGTRPGDGGTLGGEAWSLISDDRKKSG